MTVFLTLKKRRRKKKQYHDKISQSVFCVNFTKLNSNYPTLKRDRKEEVKKSIKFYNLKNFINAISKTQ